jgi:hypothetical protein
MQEIFMAMQSFERRGLSLTVTVSDESQAAELEAAWREIVTGHRTRLNTLESDLDRIMERAREALDVIVKAIERGPDTGQGRRLTRFLAGMYNGTDYPFDLTDLRCLDAELANACLDYLSYDRLGKVEVHTHLPRRGDQMQSMLERAGIRPQIRFAENHAARLEALAERLDRSPDRVLKEVLGEYLAQEEGKRFKLLKTRRPDPNGEGPIVHVRELAGAARPLCAADDGPWDERAFEFERVDCWDCRALILDHSG